MPDEDGGKPTAKPASTRRRRWVLLAGGVVVLVGALFIPDCPADAVPPAQGELYIWDQDAMWSRLEDRFVSARAQGCEGVGPDIDRRMAAMYAGLDEMSEGELAPGDELFARLESDMFELAPMFGGCTRRVPEFVALYDRLRAEVKHQSEGWDIASRADRERVYRFLYGGRAAVEELVLQMPPEDVEAITMGTDEPSESPSAVVEGVRIHSGDILLSRGGAPTSAMIARGNDWPGNFSHVALVHVSESGDVSVIESHIETGVVITSQEEYLRDVKLRIMLLRPRADLPELVANPQLAHEAATSALRAVQTDHIPYDFDMDYQDHSEMFCSEVASAAYAPLDVELWEGLTSMSSPGVTRWLSTFGVKNFVTHGPSDLEYDPKLRVVAEFRDPETLFQDHIDNAIIDAMLEGAEAGDELGYDWELLPVARAPKAYSVISWTVFGAPGPVPEGMSATSALIATRLGDIHEAIKERALPLIEAFTADNGYRPPYWELLRIARQAKGE